MIVSRVQVRYSIQRSAARPCPTRTNNPYATAMTGKTHLNLAPPLVEHGQPDSLAKAGQAICASLSPHDNSSAIYVTSEVRMTILG